MSDEPTFDPTPYPQPNEALEFLLPPELPGMHRPKTYLKELQLQMDEQRIVIADLMDRTDAREIYIETARVNRSRFDSITIEEDECGGLKVTRTKMGI